MDINKRNWWLMGLVILCSACAGTGERSRDNEKIPQIMEAEPEERPNLQVIKVTNEVKVDYQAGDTIWLGELRILINRVEAKKVNDKKDRTAQIFAGIQGKGQKEIWKIYCELLNTSKKDTMIAPFVFYQKPNRNNSDNIMEYMGMRFIMDVSKKEPTVAKSFKIPPGQKRQWMFIASNELGTDLIRFSYGGREGNAIVTFDKEIGDEPLFERFG
ncbi:MAG: hypothetical protein LUE98_05760 [Tannerellaceae bacterium]|nr:hypothetical protein [Tannerellaceae bacterium]